MSKELKKRKKRFWTFCLAAALLAQCILPLTALAATYNDSDMPEGGYPVGTSLNPGDEILVRRGIPTDYNNTEAKVTYLDEDGTELAAYEARDIGEKMEDTNGIFFMHTVKTYAAVGGTEKVGKSFQHWTVSYVYRSSGYSTEVNLKAVLEVGTYDITYHLDGGTNASGNPTSYTYGIGVASFGDASKTDYTFEGWYSDAAFTTKITSISTTQSGAVDLYAKFTATGEQNPGGTPSPGETPPSGGTPSSGGSQTPGTKSEIPPTGDGMMDFYLPALVMMSVAGIILMAKKRRRSSR